MQTVYHRTFHADAILRDGFRDGVLPPSGMTIDERGVFVSAPWPLDCNEGAHGDVVLAIDIPERLFVEYELVEEGKPYRESMIPAEMLNGYPVRILSESEEDELYDMRSDSHGLSWRHTVDNAEVGRLLRETVIRPECLE